MARIEQRICGSWGELLLSPDTRGKCAPHFHDTHAIGLCRSGGGRLFALNRTWTYAAGMLVITNPFDAHWGRPDPEGLDYLLFYPNGQWLESLSMGGGAADTWFDPPIIDDAKLAATIGQAFLSLADGGSDHLLAASIVRLFQCYGGRARRATQRYALDIAATLPRPGVTIAQAAREAGLSRTYFSRKHQHLLGLTPVQGRKQARVLAARTLIEKGELLADAAAGAGFSDQAHMTRQFRQVLGVTPTAFGPGPPEGSQRKRQG